MIGYEKSIFSKEDILWIVVRACKHMLKSIQEYI
jgi:hypothetical protein